ncbi:hypothetical protein LguiA_007396 [Lonicera macranthoides]
MCRLWLFHSTAISIIHVLETYLMHKIMYDDHDYASFLQIALIEFFLMTLFCSWLEASAIYRRGNTEIIEESFKISEKMFDQAVQIVCPGGVIFVFYINLRYPFWVWSTAFSSLITYTFSESATSGLLGPKKRHNALTSHRIAPPLFALAESNQNPFSTKACSLEPGNPDTSVSTRNTMVVFLLGSWRCCNLQSSSMSNFPVLLSCTPGTKESSLHFEKGFTCFKVVCKSTRTICRDAILLALTTQHALGSRGDLDD